MLIPHSTVSKFHAECLNAHWFMSFSDTAEKLEAWRRDYNEERPQSAIGSNVPAALMKLPDASSQSV
jgi:putative transposase